MSDICSIGFALDPTNTPSFLLDWEVTKRCNLDCSYCGVWGHDNSTDHPPLDECLKTIDFMYEYVDQYMKNIRHTQRKVILNVYGGESLFHPNIVEILEEVKRRYEAYKSKWYLTVTCTTNGIVGQNQWERIVPLIDEFTLSYHSENLSKQKDRYKDNVLYLKEKNKRFKCVIMMHNDTELFKDGELMIEFCQQNDLRYVAKSLDNSDPKWAYTEPQFQILKNFWVSRTKPLRQMDYKKSIESVGIKDQVQSINEGRACCGGRKLSLNGDLKSSVSFVPHQGFKDWYCSVNWYFLFVEQYTGNVFTNKDCKTSTTGRVEPLGNLKESNKILDTLKKQFATNIPIIKCVKDICKCGYCAPKAQTEKDFLKLLGRHVIDLGVFDSSQTKTM